MEKKKVILLAILLVIVSIISSIINGSTYTAKIESIGIENSLEYLNIIIEDENIVKCVDKKLEDGVLTIKLKSVSEGKTYLAIKKENSDISSYHSIYVHKFGVITYSDYFGDSSGSVIIPISIGILILYILVLLIKKYKKELNKNLYQYKNSAYLGLIIFLCFTFINQLIMVFNYKGLISTIRNIVALCSLFSLFLLPVAFITSILVTISNIVLMKKEGKSIKNILGVLLGLFFCFATIFPNLLNEILQRATWVDVHNEQGIALYIQNFVEFAVYLVVSYLECVLLGTIIIGIKSARHIPEFNKDFIIILGCKIKKDGTLTNLLKGRVDRAIEFRNMQKDGEGKDLIFVPSGGQGNDEAISEAQAMKNYLLENGIKEEEILVENKSKNTFENIKFSNALIKEKMNNAKIAFSTTNYHVYRAGAIANSQGIDIEGIGAKTKSYFWVNAFIREFIATLASEKKKHIITICTILLISIGMIVLEYISNCI